MWAKHAGTDLYWKKCEAIDELLTKSRYNNGLIAKLMLTWRREGMREMRTWFLYKHQARHGSIYISGPK
jgi:hypothetical protein